jgi:hypothetical protein
MVAGIEFPPVQKQIQSFAPRLANRLVSGLWSRALGSVSTRPDVLFHVLTSKAGLIRATPDEDSKKRKRDTVSR